MTIGDQVVLERSGPSNRAGNATAGYAKFGLYDYWHTVADVLDATTGAAHVEGGLALVTWLGP